MSTILGADRLCGADDPFADRRHVVVAFCAEWCGTCRSFRPVLEALAAAYPQLGFAWLDIEDDAELVGEIEVDSFPTLAIFDRGVALYFGVTLPLQEVVARLIRSALGADQPLVEVPAELAALGARIFAPTA